MKKITLIAALLIAATTLFAKTIYLQTGGAAFWNQADAKFATWTWGPGDAFSEFMTPVAGEDGLYETEIADTHTNAIFIRFKPEVMAPSWTESDRWNKTGDLTFAETENLYTITGWEDLDGTWGTYTPPTGLTQAEVLNLYAADGMIYSTGNAQIFTLTGLNVTAQNGNLKGAYIVKVDGKVSKIMVK